MEFILDDAVLKIHVISHLMNLKRQGDISFQSIKMPEDLKKSWNDVIDYWKENQIIMDSSENEQSTNCMQRILSKIPTENDYTQQLIQLNNYRKEDFGDFLEFCHSFKLLVDLWKMRIKKSAEIIAEEQNELKELNSSINCNIKIIKQLNEQLISMKNTKDEICSRHECTLKQFEDEIDYVKKVRKEEKAKIIDVSKRKIKEIYENYFIESKNLQKSIDSVTILYQEMHDKFLQEERQLRDKKRKIQDDLQQLIKDYDIEMFAKDDECKNIKNEIKNLNEQIEMLKIETKPIKEQYDKIIHERTLEEERKGIVRERIKQYRAACLVQSVWRGYKCRKFLKILKAKKSGKKIKAKQ